MPWFCTQFEKLTSGFGDTLSQFFFPVSKDPTTQPPKKKNQKE
jgi:hypothetical protein